MIIVPKKIYFDMDGVLADFKRGVLEYCGLDMQHQRKGLPAVSTDLLWERIRLQDHFFDRLELLPGAREMFDLVYSKYGKRCEILTAIPNPTRGILTAGEDKIRWMRRLFPEQVVVNIVYRKEKLLFCKGKGSILIDDFKENIKNWEAHGGTGIYHTSSEETVAILQEMGII